MKAKKIIVPVSIVAGIAAIGTAVVILGNSASQVSYADTVTIQDKAIEDKISVSGTLQSSDRKNVYAQLNYQVEKVNVSVGDVVKKGDVLCTISTDDLQQQILQQQAAVDSSGVSSDYNLSEAERRYAEALDQYGRGDNTYVLNASKAVEQAEKNLAEAKRQAASGTGTTLPSNIQSANTSVESAKLTYENAKLSYENAKKTYENSVKNYNDAENALKPENYPVDLKAVKDKLDEAEADLELVNSSRYNPELDGAKATFERAKEKYVEVSANPTGYSASYTEEVTAEYTEAKIKYEAMQKKYDKDTLEEQIKTLKTQIDSAVENLERSRDSAKISMDNAKANMDSIKISMDSAKLAYDNALAGYDTIVKQNDNAEESYNTAVKNAEDALAAAKNDYDLAVRQAESDLASLKKAAEQQRTVSGLNDPQIIMLQNLKDKLEYAVVTAPCDGIITAVNAEEGAVAAGVLFTIENIDTLKISASVGEYDIPYIKEGMTAMIRCDALGSTEFEGTITSVAKTPEPADIYSNQSGTNYKIEVSINSDDERLLAGMNAKVSIITEQKAGALTITYDALTTDDSGNDAVYIAEKGDDGVYRAKLVPVTVGLETDYEIEIISPELKAGMLVLTDTSTIMDGSVVMIDES